MEEPKRGNPNLASNANRDKPQENWVLIVDCTKQSIQRPADDVAQRSYYCGEKKRHTLKTEYVATAQGRIASVSPSHPGSRHNLSIRRAGPVLLGHVRIYADSAYQGYDKDHPNLDIPYKKPKNGTLSDEEKQYNRGLGSFRVAVERRIGRTKRFKMPRSVLAIRSIPITPKSLSSAAW